MSDFIQGLDGDFFVQDNIAETFWHLDCVGIGDIPMPRGDLTPVYCPDPLHKGKVVVDGKIQGDPGLGTLTINRPLSNTINWLLENDCDFNGFIGYACQGIRTVYENFQSGIVLLGLTPTNTSVLAAVARDRGDDTRIDTSAELAFDSRYMIYHTQINQIVMANTAAANAVAMLPASCQTKCAAQRRGCSYGYMALNGTLYDSEVKYTKDGTSWYQTPTDPFDEGGDTGDIEIFEMWDGHRAVFSRVSASTHLPAEVSYTEDWGVTWTNVDVGAEIGQTIQDLCQTGGWLYAACSGGDIYRSKVMGDVWERICHGVTAEQLNSIDMFSKAVGYAVGHNNTFLYTTNGEDWYTRVGPAPGVSLLSVGVNRAGHVFVGAADGNLYVSQNEGQTWETRREFGLGVVNHVAFDPVERYFGALLFNTPVPVGTFYTSINGGATWRTPAGQIGNWNAGLNNVFICDPNNYYLVGEPLAGNTFVAKVGPAS